MGDGFKLPSRWVYGGVLQGRGGHSIIYGGENQNDPGEGLEKHIVYTDTLGQFTSLTDKNGVKIFEGDIVRCNRFSCDGKDMVGHIVYSDSGFCVKEHKTPNEPSMSLCDDFEIIGNIHDNPELLEVRIP